MTSDLQKMEQARSFSPVFASQDVSWYTFPWQPWRSNPLHARGSGTGRLSRVGSWEPLFLHAPQRREPGSRHGTVAEPCAGTRPTRKLLLAAPRATHRGAPFPLGPLRGGEAAPREREADSSAVQPPFRKLSAFAVISTSHMYAN